MEIVFLAKGHCQLGMSTHDNNGNIIESKPATFTVAADGPCVAVGTLDSETMEQTGEIALYGDWDASGYLKETLERLAPNRQHNIPNLEQIVKAMNADGVDVCDYCQEMKCSECILKMYKESEE